MVDGPEIPRLVDALVDATFEVIERHGEKSVWNVLLYSITNPVEAVQHERRDSSEWECFEEAVIRLHAATWPGYVLLSIRQAIEKCKSRRLHRDDASAD